MADAPYIGSGLPLKVITTDGELDLFRIAAREMGDALYAWQIAEANGLSDFWPAAGLSLAIPVPSGDTNDGLPPQQ